MNRRIFLATAAKAGLAGVTLGGMGVGLAGCGSGSKKNSDGQTIQTNGNGRVQDVVVDSGGRSVFIVRTQDIVIDWPDGNPPAQFTVFLRRFKENRGGEPLDITTQKIDVTQINGSKWLIKRRDSFDLDAGGVYYLEVGSPGQTAQRFVFIVGNDRSVTVNPNTGGFLEDVIISPRPGFAFVERSQIFTLEWTGAFPPPNQFTASLRRYKEERGDELRSDTEQQIDLIQQGNNFIWALGRRDNFAMDANATYYIELTSPGGGLVRAPYLTGAF